MIRLESGALVCEIEPALGGCIAGLWLDGLAVLRSTRTPLVSARQSGSDELLRIRISSNLGRLVVFTNGSRDTIAIEPVSHVNNAINLVAAGADPAALGLSTLEPGETLTAQMSIEVERVQ